MSYPAISFRKMLSLKLWSRAVWKEGDVEEELAVPSSWVSLEENLLYWPPKSINDQLALKSRREPTKNWRKYQLVKVKFTSGKLIYIFLKIMFIVSLFRLKSVMIYEFVFYTYFVLALLLMTVCHQGPVVIAVAVEWDENLKFDL